MEDVYKIIQEMEERIAELPVGYISRKTIKGKVHHYRQWREGGKIKSKYIRESNLAEIQCQIGERKQLEERVKELRKQFPIQDTKDRRLITNFRTGDVLQRMVQNVSDLKKRDCFAKLVQYLRDDKNWTRVCVVYGLRRTGKTTMLFQGIAEMDEKEQAKAAYIKMRKGDVMRDLIHDLDILYRDGCELLRLIEVGASRKLLASL